MINWHEVTVGETKIGAPNGCKYIVIGRRGNAVWLEDENGFHYTVEVFDTSKWTIYDPWEDVSEECEFNPTGCVIHKGVLLCKVPRVFESYRFGPGLRVAQRS